MSEQMSFANSGGLIDDAKKTREPAWDKDISWFELPDDSEIHTYRLVAGAYYYAQHWVQTVKKDGKPGKAFPVICQNFDHQTNTYAENGCEVCTFLSEVNKTVNEINETREAKDKIEWKALPSNIQRMSRRLTMASNVIVRELQQQGPPANAQGWSFIRAIRLPQGFGKTLKEKQDKLNKRDGQIYPLNHITEGRDLMISYNSQSENKNNIYSLDLGNVVPLTEDEMKHQPFLVNFHSFMKYPKQNEIADSLRRFGYYNWINEFRNTSTLVSVPKQTNVPPPQPAPVQAGRQSGQSAFNPPASPEPPFEEEPAAAPPVPAPVVQPVAQPAPVPAAPATPVPVQQQQAAPASKPAAQPTQVVQNMAGQANIEGRLQLFATNTGVQLVVNGTTYQKNLRMYRPDLAVPTCWTTYSQTSSTPAGKAQCKACPLRLDCMMIS